MTERDHSIAAVSPKQPTSRADRDWYPYYAGFTERFVDTVITEYLKDSFSVLDPWSGSGTTTVTCLRRGLRSVGIDINPATTVIARGRLVPASTKEDVVKLGLSIVKAAEQTHPAHKVKDPLALWVADSTLRDIRSILAAVHHVLCEKDATSGSGDDLNVDQLSQLACFFYTACFGVARDLLKPYRTTNPMWIKAPKNSADKVQVEKDALFAAFMTQVRFLAARLSLEDNDIGTAHSTFRTGNAIDTGLTVCSFDATITSPPYATRVDYVRGYLPELALLGAHEDCVERLRAACTGSPKVRGVPPSTTELRTQTGTRLLAAVRKHRSKGSQSYYYPWIRNYLVAIQQGLSEIHRVVNPSGVVCIVVQDSAYKEIHIDMQKIITEILVGCGRFPSARHDYPAPHPRVRHAPKQAHVGAAHGNTESLLVFADETHD